MSDERKVKRYIEEGILCSGNILLNYYLKCKTNNKEVPNKIQCFVDTCLCEVVHDLNQGLAPRYDDIFKIKRSKGRNSRHEMTALKEEIIIGSSIDRYKQEGVLHGEAIEKVAEERVLSTAVVIKTYTKYRKNE
jgi:hypothetical protein